VCRKPVRSRPEFPEGCRKKRHHRTRAAGNRQDECARQNLFASFPVFVASLNSKRFLRGGTGLTAQSRSRPSKHSFLQSRAKLSPKDQQGIQARPRRWSAALQGLRIFSLPPRVDTFRVLVRRRKRSLFQKNVFFEYCGECYSVGRLFQSERQPSSGRFFRIPKRTKLGGLGPAGHLGPSSTPKTGFFFFRLFSGGFA